MRNASTVEGVTRNRFQDACEFHQLLSAASMTGTPSVLLPADSNTRRRSKEPHPGAGAGPPQNNYRKVGTVKRAPSERVDDVDTKSATSLDREARRGRARY